MATLLSYYLRLTCIVTNTGPRLAFGGVANTLPNGISTRIAGGFLFRTAPFSEHEKLRHTQLAKAIN